mmetsp:Transcript_8549/g.24438  ORF Transcript_8549/g.24438 Transcript_8549/m.24438 type:complete len:212 (+) Transcript_8549:605-1240(+)
MPSYTTRETVASTRSSASRAPRNRATSEISPASFVSSRTPSVPASSTDSIVIASLAVLETESSLEPFIPLAAIRFSTGMTFHPSPDSGSKDTRKVSNTEDADSLVARFAVSAASSRRWTDAKCRPSAVSTAPPLLKRSLSSSLLKAVDSKHDATHFSLSSTPPSSPQVSNTNVFTPSSKAFTRASSFEVWHHSSFPGADDHNAALRDPDRC